MTLSAKQIIAGLEGVSDLLKDGYATGHAADVDAAIAYIKAMHPRPIEEAKDGHAILALWFRGGSIVDASSDIWHGKEGWLFPPAHFIPLDALPLPEGE